MAGGGTPNIYLPFDQPVVDPRTGKMTRAWINALNAWAAVTVQGPNGATDGATAKFDGPTGRLLKS